MSDWNPTLLALAALALSACGSAPGAPAPDASAADSGDGGAVPGCEADVRLDARCRPRLPRACPGGTMAQAGRSDCVATGVATCGAGQVRDDAGFGCAAELPASCAPGDRPAAGCCVPMGDCAAPFPPAGATVVVDDDGPLDATHVRTLAEGLLRAGDGGVVAVEAGTYAEQLALTSAVTLRGRCAAQVFVTEPPDAGSTALAVSAGATVTLSGLTVRGFDRAVLADGASHVVVEACELAAPHGLGFHARAGSTLTLSDVYIHDVTPTAQGVYGWGGAIYGGASVTATRLSVVRTTSYGVLASDAQSRFEGHDGLITSTRFASGVAGPDAAGLVAQKGATVSVEDYVVDDSDRHGVRASSASTLALTRALVTRTHGDSGAGLAALTGSAVTAVDTTLDAHPRHGVFADGAGATASLTRCLVSRSGDDGAAALFSLDGARVSLDQSAVVNVGSAGLTCVRATARVADTLVRDVAPRAASASVNAIRYGAGLESLGGCTFDVARVTVERSTSMGCGALNGGVMRGGDLLVQSIRAPRPVDTWGYGVGLWASHGGRLDVARAVVIDVPGLGVWVSASGTAARFEDLVVANIGADVDGAYGHGLVVGGGGLVELERPVLAASAGVGLLAVAGAGWVKGGALVGNTVALHVQDGSTIVESDATGAVGAGELRVSSNTSFLDNASRVGVGVIPVPADPLR